MPVMDTYKYFIELTYLDVATNKSTVIPTPNVKSLAIDFDYQINTMPVVMAVVSIDRNLRDDMIEKVNKNRMVLNVQKLCETSGDDIPTDYIPKMEFAYFIKEEKNKRPDYLGTDEERTDLLAVTSIVLLPYNNLINNKKVVNNIIYKNTMSSIIKYYSNPLGNILLEPLTYNKFFPQIMVPTNTTTINAALKYLNTHISAFYDSMYRFFMDFDITYIISSSGRPVPKKGEKYNTVYIDITEVAEFNPYIDTGMVTEKKNNRYYIPIGVYKTNLSEVTPNIKSRSYSILTGVDAQGNSVQYDINVLKNPNVNANSIVEVENGNLNYVKNLACQYRTSAIALTLTKSDLDSSVLTINKEYMIKFDDKNSKYDGKFILSKKTEYYSPETYGYRMSTALTLNRVDLV